MIYVASTAVIVGDVTMERDVSVWHGTVLRGDLEAISIGQTTNLQDGVVVHSDVGCPVRVGRRVTVGHGAVIHACEVGDDCIIGMNATLSSRATVGDGSIVAPGAVVPEGKEFPPGSLLGGVPARVIREISETDRVRIEGSWRVYLELAKKSLEGREEMRGDPGARCRISFLEGAEP
jgi:carbonic anhydrase/acetyltransferase-like protein (isoleucine patch superfamily)